MVVYIIWGKFHNDAEQYLHGIYDAEDTANEVARECNWAYHEHETPFKFRVQQMDVLTHSDTESSKKECVK